MQFKQSWASRISPSVAIAVCSLLVAAASLLISWNQLNLNTIITNLQKERERVIFHGRSNWDTEEYKLGTEELLIFATGAKIFDIKLYGSLSVEYENADGQACHFLISDYYHPTYTGKDIGLLAQLSTPNNKLTSDKYLEALRATGKLSKIVEQSPVISVRFLWPRADRFELDYFLFDRHRNHLTLNQDHFTLEALGQMEHDAYERDLSLGPVFN